MVQEIRIGLEVGWGYVGKNSLRTIHNKVPHAALIRPYSALTPAHLRPGTEDSLITMM